MEVIKKIGETKDETIDLQHPRALNTYQLNKYLLFYHKNINNGIRQLNLSMYLKTPNN